MNNIAETNKVLALLNLKLVTKGKDYLILNSNTDEITRLQPKENAYEYFFIKDEIAYYLQITNDKLLMKTSEGNNFIFKEDEFLYSVPEEDGVFNKEVMNVTNNSLSFYEKTPLDEGYQSKGIRTSFENGEFIYLKTSEDFSFDGTFKKDNIFREEKSMPKKIIMTRKYNSEGKQLIGSIQEELIDNEINDCILDEIKENDVVENIITKVDNLIPGVIEMLEEQFRQLEIINKKEKTI